MTQAVYIIGAPGAGKSTMMRELLQGWEVGPYTRLTTRELFGHFLQRGDETGVYLGHLRDEYPGTDALSMSVAPQVMLWLEALPLLGLDWVFGEGARLTHFGFFEALAQVSDLTVIYLQVDPEVAAERRLKRGGKQFKEQFVKMNMSKAEGAARRCREAGIRVVEQTSPNP